MSGTIKIECVDGPCDGYAEEVDLGKMPLEEKTFLFARTLEGGVKVVSAYAWTGRMSADGVALLGHVIEVGTMRKDGPL